VTEVRKVLELENNPSYIFRLIHRAQFWELLFCPPPVPEVVESDTSLEADTSVEESVSSVQTSILAEAGTLGGDTSFRETSITSKAKLGEEITSREPESSGTSVTDAVSSVIAAEGNVPEAVSLNAISSENMESAAPTLVKIEYPSPNPLDDVATSTPQTEINATSNQTSQNPPSDDKPLGPGNVDNRKVYTSADLPTNTTSSVTATFFVHKLTKTWELWTRFEEALLFNPKTHPKAPKRIKNLADLHDIQAHITSFAFAVAAVHPWRHHPCKPPPEVDAVSMAGWVVEDWFEERSELWKQIDVMFYGKLNVWKAFEEALAADEVSDARAFKEQHEKFWAAKILGGAIFRWCELCEGKIGEEELEEMWNQTQGLWMDMGRAVGNIHWEFAEEEKRAQPVEV